MMRCGFVSVLLLVTSGSGAEPIAGLPDDRVAIEAEPDTTLAIPLPNCPNADDLARLQFVEGKPKGVVLRVLGHPCRVVKRANGVEIWDYPWMAACEVWVRNGICIKTFYTGGY